MYPWIVLLLSAAAIACALWIIPVFQVRRIRFYYHLTASERFDKENEARKTLSQVVGGLAILVAIYSTNQTLTNSQQQMELSRSAQFSDRFIKATEQLGATTNDGKKKIELRLGAIYSLKRLAAESPTDLKPVLEVLAAYVRTNAAWTSTSEKSLERPGSAPDVQAALIALTSRATVEEPSDLAETDLRAANLRGANLRGAFLWGAHLEGAYLRGCQLQGAILVRANLDGVDLTEASLKDATIAQTTFNGTLLAGTDLTGTDLSDAIGLTDKQLEVARKGLLVQPGTKPSR